MDANNRIYRSAKIIIKPPSNWEYHTFPGKHRADRATVRVMQRVYTLSLRTSENLE